MRRFYRRRLSELRRDRAADIVRNDFYRAAALGPVTALSQAEMSSFLQRFDRPRHVAKLWRYYLGHCVRSGAVSHAWAEQAGEPT